MAKTFGAGGLREGVDRGKEAVSEVIYGTVTLMAVVIALENGGYGPWRVVAVILVATYTLAFAKVYANTIAEMLAKGRRISMREVRGIWRESRPVTIYSQLPTLAFVLSGLGVFSLGAAFWIAQLTGVAILFIAGYLVGRRVGASAARSVFSGFAVGAVGAAIMLLKLLSH